MGFLLEQDLGASADKQQAFYWYEKAGEQGHVEAWDCCITKVGKASFRITPRRWRCLKRRQSRGIFRRRLTAGECFSRAKASEATGRRLWTGIARPLSAWA
ncbi:MAG: SEL1-like repeat protein [Clostridiaceae bacterium]|nr:SEL1-like repeat protein [Clostridiaceae bacterium]